MNLNNNSKAWHSINPKPKPKPNNSTEKNNTANTLKKINISHSFNSTVDQRLTNSEFHLKTCKESNPYRTVNRMKLNTQHLFIDNERMANNFTQNANDDLEWYFFLRLLL